MACGENYLKNRTSNVKIDNTYSDPITATEGTAQGSVLGPLHFLSYVNEMSNCIDHCTCYQFADDTCLVAVDQDPQKARDFLQSDLSALTRWCHDAGLVLNVDKTKLIIIKSPYIKKSPLQNVVAHAHGCLHGQPLSTCNCPTIEVLGNQTYLGLSIDSKFNWSSHVERVCNKLRQFIANITILKDRIPFKVKLMLYNSLAQSYIQYGLSSYGRTYSTYLNQIYRLQLKILKIIVSTQIKIQFQNDDIGLFRHCKTLPVHTQFKFNLLKEHFFNAKFKKEVKHPVYTRAVAQNRLLEPRARNTYGERTASYLVPRLINNLPTDLVNSITSKNIRFKLKSYFLANLEKYQ